MQDLLAAALPMDRGLERRFRDWLAAAHQTLDKNIRFENMASSQEQVSNARQSTAVQRGNSTTI